MARLTNCPSAARLLLGAGLLLATGLVVSVSAAVPPLEVKASS